MKSERGITLASLAIYIVVILIALITLSMIITYFRSNVNEFNTKTTVDLEFDKFNLYFIEEVKKINNKIDETNSSETKVVFTSGNTYEFSEKSIILNSNVKIAEKIENCTFSFSTDKNNLKSITVYMKVGETERTNQYTLSNQTTGNVDNEDYIYGYRRVIGTDELILETSIKTKLKDYKIYGNSVKDGTPSQSNPIEIQSVGDKTVNLLDPTLNFVPSSNQGITIEYLEEEDCFVLNGTAEKTQAYNSRYINLPITNGAYFSISTEYVSGTVTRINASDYALVRFGAANTINTSNNWKTVTLKEENTQTKNVQCSYSYITRVWFYITAGVSFDNYKVRVQLEEGSISTEYEPYGWYKIPIEVTGKNLIDISKTQPGYISSNGRLTSSTAINTTDFIYVEEGKKYTFSYEYEELQGTASKYIAFYNSPNQDDCVQDKNITYLPNKKTISFVAPITGYVRVCYYNNVYNIQLEENAEATKYEPNVGTIKTNIYLNEPLRKIGNYADYIDFENRKIYRKVQIIDNTGTLPLEQSLRGIEDNEGMIMDLPNIQTHHGYVKVRIQTEIPPSNTEVVYYSK